MMCPITQGDHNYVQNREIVSREQCGTRGFGLQMQNQFSARLLSTSFYRRVPRVQLVHLTSFFYLHLFWIRTFWETYHRLFSRAGCPTCHPGNNVEAFFMVALCNRADHNIFMLFLLSSSSSFFSSSSSLFSSPNLSGRRLDVYHTLAHGVALLRIQNAGLKCAARGSLQIQDAKKSPKIGISAPSHTFVGPYLRN